MNFDINATLSQMLDAIKGIVKNDGYEIEDNAADFFNDRKERLQTLAIQRLNGEIDDAFLKDRLMDEQDILLAEIDAAKIVAKSVAQVAANAAIDIFQKAIIAAIKL